MKIISANSPGEGYSAKDTVELLRMDLSQAVKKVAADDLRQWGKWSATLLTDSFKNRIKNIVQLIISGVGNLAGESSLEDLVDGSTGSVFGVCQLESFNRA